MKYAVLVKHMFREISDVRLEIIEVPDTLEFASEFGPYEAKAYVQSDLLGPFEVIAVTDRISEFHVDKVKWDKIKDNVKTLTPPKQDKETRDE